MLRAQKYIDKLDLSATSPVRVFLFQVVATLSLFSFFKNATGVQWIVCLIVYFLMVVVGGTVTYHRLLTHRAFRPKAWFAIVGPLLGTLIGAGSTVAWVATHRHHHLGPDTSKDPHSPLHQPWYQVLWLSMFHKPRLRFALDLLRSPLHLRLHKYYWGIHLIYFSILIMLDPFAVVYAYLAPAALAWNAASLVNWINHVPWVGYRNHATKDQSRNSLLTGFLVGGEGFHNNHHAHPQKYDFGEKWYEFDVGGWLIKNCFMRQD